MGSFPAKENIQWNRDGVLSRNKESSTPDRQQLYKVFKENVVPDGCPVTHNLLETSYQNLYVSGNKRFVFLLLSSSSSSSSSLLLLLLLLLLLSLSFCFVFMKS